MVEKKTRVPLLLSKEEIEGIEEWKARRGHRTTAEAVRELIDNGKALPLLVVDLLDAIEAEGFLYYEDMAAPIQAIIDKLELYVDLTFPQLEKGVADGKPYWAAREAIRVARLEIEEAKKQPPRPAKIRFRKVSGKEKS